MQRSNLEIPREILSETTKPPPPFAVSKFSSLHHGLLCVSFLKGIQPKHHAENAKRIWREKSGSGTKPSSMPMARKNRLSAGITIWRTKSSFPSRPGV